MRGGTVAAVVLPNPHDRWECRPPLRLVRPQPPRRPTPAVFRRRRLLAVVLLALLIAGLALGAGPALRAGVGVLGGRPLTPSGSPGSVAMQPVVSRFHVVQPGDTLWSVARRMQPSGDIRPLVDRLAAARRGTVLHPGELIGPP